MRQPRNGVHLYPEVRELEYRVLLARRGTIGFEPLAIMEHCAGSSCSCRVYDEGAVQRIGLVTLAVLVDWMFLTGELIGDAEA